MPLDSTDRLYGILNTLKLNLSCLIIIVLQGLTFKYQARLFTEYLLRVHEILVEG